MKCSDVADNTILVVTIPSERDVGLQIVMVTFLIIVTT